MNDLSAGVIADAASDGSEATRASYARIWAAVTTIPPGRIASFAQVAAAAGFPRQPRLAGYALHRLPAGSDVPWHRVVNAQGRIAFPAASAAYREQRQRLESEGVAFVAGRVDWRRYGCELGGGTGDTASVRARPFTTA
ncbi:MAG TPA: MGMT family protein [Candidatus Binatia bacterium]|nr:MGMT family protein [Candidatus Binatia bacterium]